jgi:hypothetical protein
MRPLVILLSLLYSSVLPGQNITRQQNETTAQFIKRIQPKATKLAHPLIETNSWDSLSKTIIAFYGYEEPGNPNGDFNKISGHVYLAVGQNKYRDISLQLIEEDGGLPEILAVFFANADKDKAEELVVLCKVPQQHYDYNGAFYNTYIFDNPGTGSQLTYLKKLSANFDGCDCSFRDGRKPEMAKYKTAKEIKTKLKQMGF